VGLVKTLVVLPLLSAFIFASAHKNYHSVKAELSVPQGILVKKAFAYTRPTDS
jgi:hypothetical protein